MHWLMKQYRNQNAAWQGFDWKGPTCNDRVDRFMVVCLAEPVADGSGESA